MISSDENSISNSCSDKSERVGKNSESKNPSFKSERRSPYPKESRVKLESLQSFKHLALKRPNQSRSSNSLASLDSD